ncbi:MAG: hypothetical protein ACI97P_003051, partial [Arcticibacterium sp.]
FHILHLKKNRTAIVISIIRLSVSAFGYGDVRFSNHVKGFIEKIKEALKNISFLTLTRSLGNAE